jgi:NAD-dependent oxidoreductase involved in siderophore biosynthesis
VVAAGRTIAHRYPLVNGLARQTLALDFTLPGDPADPDAGTEILLRLHTVGIPTGTLTGARLLRASAPAVA